MRTKSTQGFTLIELLIVIAIIGILAAVLIPNLMNARTTASQRAAQAHSQNVYTAMVAALADYVTSSVSDLGPTTCMNAASVTVGTGGNTTTTAYSYNAAPAQTTACTVNVTGNEPVVTVTWGAGGTQRWYVNGVEHLTDPSGSGGSGGSGGTGG